MVAPGAEIAVSQDNMSLPGSLTPAANGCAVWRPESGFVQGATLYVAPLDDDSSFLPELVQVGEFVPVGEVTLSVKLDFEMRPGEEGRCCPLSGLAVGGDPEGTPARPSGCPVEVEEEVLLASLESEGVPAGQLLFRADLWPAAEAPPDGFHLLANFTGLLTEDQAHVGGGEVCFEGTAWNLLSDEKFEVDVCSSVPAWTPKVTAVDVLFQNIRSCDTPPVGYEESWCDGMRFECVTLADQLVGFEQEFQVQSCANFYELCDVEPPQLENRPAEYEGASCSTWAGAPRSPSENWGFSAALFLTLIAVGRQRRAG